jgi:hypothetical protein
MGTCTQTNNFFRRYRPRRGHNAVDTLLDLRLFKRVRDVESARKPFMTVGEAVHKVTADLGTRHGYGRVLTMQ